MRSNETVVSVLAAWRRRLYNSLADIVQLGAPEPCGFVNGTLVEPAEIVVMSMFSRGVRTTQARAVWSC